MGLEPTTFGVTGRCSNLLSHIPLVLGLLFNIPRILTCLHFFDELRHESVEDAKCIPRQTPHADGTADGFEGLDFDVEDDSFCGKLVGHGFYYTKF